MLKIIHNREYRLITLMAVAMGVTSLYLISHISRPADDGNAKNNSVHNCSFECSHESLQLEMKILEQHTRERLFTEIPNKEASLRMVTSNLGESDWEGQIGGAIRANKIEVSADFLVKKPFQRNEVLSLNLFDDVKIDAQVYESFENVNGTICTTARLANTLFGRAVLALTDNELRVKVILPESNQIYAIHYNHQDDSHYALQLDPALVDTFTCATVKEDGFFTNPLTAASEEFAAVEQFSSSPMVESDEGTALVVIDTMVVYPENVISSAGSEANVKNIAAQGIALANDVHITTNTGMYINLAHTARLTGYTDTGDLNEDLDRLTFSSSNYYTFWPDRDPSGHIDEVHVWRDEQGADFVLMMHSDSAGLGWTPNFSSTDSGSPQFGFSVTGWTRFSSYAPAHEIGHNMNLHHSKYQSISPGNPELPTGTDAAGWHWHPGGDPFRNGYCSVMSYTEYPNEAAHVIVGLFSDPNIVHEGQAAGDAQDGNSARVLRAYKNIYANYRTRPMAANSILVQSPNGGEPLVHGDTVEIRWNTNTVPGNVKIELYKSGSFERELASSTLNDRIFYYTIPEDLPSSSLYQLRISSVNNQTIEDFSDANFTIGESIYATNLDSNPGFATTGEWAYGAPGGENSTFGGAGTAYTGTNIYDTNLYGGTFSTCYLTTPTINCSNFEGVTLKFAGWFSVTSNYQARVEVSNDGSSWTQLSSVTDIWTTSWTQYVYDISSIADGQSTVYVRWTHFKSSDEAGNYSGMSIDDVSLYGTVAPSAFQSWSDGLTADADSNGDGIKNGVAWVIGSDNPFVSATAVLPSIDNENPEYMIFTYRRIDEANSDPSTSIALEYSSDLSAWTAAIHDNNNVIITETDDFYAAGVDQVRVQLKRTLTTENKLFARLIVNVDG